LAAARPPFLDKKATENWKACAFIWKCSFLGNFFQNFDKLKFYAGSVNVNCITYCSVKKLKFEKCSFSKLGWFFLQTTRSGAWQKWPVQYEIVFCTYFASS
jgi:hypothetical protein